jgi:hypothetical protein
MVYFMLKKEGAFFLLYSNQEPQRITSWHLNFPPAGFCTPGVVMARIPLAYAKFGAFIRIRMKYAIMEGIYEKSICTGSGCSDVCLASGGLREQLQQIIRFLRQQKQQDHTDTVVSRE